MVVDIVSLKCLGDATVLVLDGWLGEASSRKEVGQTEMYKNLSLAGL